MSSTISGVEPFGIGRYLVGPRLGAGGMATVHIATVSGGLGFSRVVAIKRIHPTLATDRELVQAIRDEARIAARIRHPNVVAVVDVVVADDDVQIVLEYVHGESLVSLLRNAKGRNQPLPVGVAVAIAVDALHGLQAAHEATDEEGRPLQVVHRDVSPQNVIVGADGVARVLDFGIAKAQNRAAETRDGVLKGKLSYMAPEQLGGEVSAKSDSYALALVLWEMLVGRSPFVGGATHGETLAKVIRGVDTPPSAYRPDVPQSLDSIVMRALAVSPSERFDSARTMADALERCGVAASRSEVSRAVMSLAGDVLQARAAVITRLERTPPTSRPMLLQEADPRATGTPLATSTDTSNTANTSNTSRTVPPTRHNPLVPITLFGVAFLLGLIALVTWRRGTRGPEHDALAHHDFPDAAPLALATSAAAPASSSTAPAPSTSAPAPIAASGRPADTARPPDPSSRPFRPPQKTSATQAPSPNCSPPYTVDENGFRHYRRECFQK